LRSVVATVVEAFTAVAADFTVEVEAFTVEVEAFTAVAGFGVVVGFAAEAFSVAETGSAAVERSAVESGFVAPELSAAAFVAAAFAAGGAGVGADGVGVGVGVGDSVLVGAGPMGDTPIRTHTILGGGLPTMTHTIIPLPPIRILTTGTEILNAQTRLLNPATGARRLQLTIRGLPRRTALSVLPP
jgi:hypothetical protein